MRAKQARGVCPGRNGAYDLPSPSMGEGQGEGDEANRESPLPLHHSRSFPLIPAQAGASADGTSIHSRAKSTSPIYKRSAPITAHHAHHRNQRFRPTYCNGE